MKNTYCLALLSGLLVLSGSSLLAQWDPAPGTWINTPLMFTNNSGYHEDEVWISFDYGIAQAETDTTIYPQYYGANEFGAPGNLSYGGYQQPNWQSVQLSSLKTNFNGSDNYMLFLSNYNGRIYVNYGTSALTQAPPAGQPVTSKYVVFETTIGGKVNNVVTPPSPAQPYIPTSSSNIDLSYVDGISAGANTSINSMSGTPLPATTINPVTSTTTIAQDVAAFVASKLTPEQAAQAIETDGNGNIMRVFSGSYAPSGTYHNWDTVLGSGATLNVSSFTSPTNSALTPYGLSNVWWGQNPTAPISGQMPGFENQQGYTASATFSSSEITITGQGTSYNGSTPAGAFTITIDASVVNTPSGGYGNNPSYTVTYSGGSYTTNGIQNDLGGTVVGDVLAAMVFGMVDSEISISSHATTTGLDLFGWTPSSDVLSEISTGEFFYLASLAGAQGMIKDWIGEPIAVGSDYYDIYAYAIAMFSQSYGTAFGDRFQGLYNPDTSWYTSYPPADPNSTDVPPADFETVGYVELTLHDAQAVPEPSTWALLALGGLGLAYTLRRRRLAQA